MIGQVISHYRVIEQIGAGGMGVVFRAEDTRLGRPLVLKFLPPALSRDPMALERFEREAKTASSMNHPGICTVYDIGEFEGQRYIAMEHLEGQPLDRFIGGKPLPLPTMLDLAVEITDAIELAHSQGILHRDIKPANIFVTKRGHAKVLDFGLAKLAAGADPSVLDANEQTLAAHVLTTVGVAVGTVAYMSPEQARGEELDTRSDLFSLGVVLHEMSTGRQAFAGPTAAVVFDAILNRTPPAIVSLNPEVPLELERIVDKAIEKDRLLRYQHAADLKSDLARLRRDRDSGRVSIGGLSASRSGVRPATADGNSSAVEIAVPLSTTPSSSVPAAASSAAAIPAPVTPAAPQAAPAQPTAKKKGSTNAIAAAVGVLAIGAAAVGYVITRPASEPQATVSQQPAAAPATPETVAPPPVPEPSPVAEPKPAPAPPVAGTSPASPPSLDAATAQALPKPANTGTATAAGTAARRAPAAPSTIAVAPTTAPGAAGRTPVPPPVAAPDPVASAVESARSGIDHGQFDAALAGLQGALGERPTSPSAAQARWLIAQIYDRQRRTDAALAAYADLRATYSKDPVSADALLRMADLVQQTKRPDRNKVARTYLDDIVANFSSTDAAPRALSQRAVIEERENAKVTDPVLQRVVPAALVSYRQLIEAYPQSASAETAYVKLARFYDDLKRYDLQAQALSALGASFPKTRYDAWWEAGEVYERRLRENAKAKDAYARVPNTSRRYRDAQKKLSEL